MGPWKHFCRALVKSGFTWPLSESTMRICTMQMEGLTSTNFCQLFESENYQTHSNPPGIGQDCDADLYQAGTHLDIDASLPSCSKNSESSNVRFAGDQINDTALYNANNELDPEEFPSDLWGSNIPMPPFNALQSQGNIQGPITAMGIYILDW
jgi:hypothetical protein